MSSSSRKKLTVMSSGWKWDNFFINSISFSHPFPHSASTIIELHRKGVCLAIWLQRHETCDTDLANFKRSSGRIGPASNMAESISWGMDATCEWWNAMSISLETKFNIVCCNGREAMHTYRKLIESDVKRADGYSLLNTVTGQRWCGGIVKYTNRPQAPVTCLPRVSWGYEGSKSDIAPRRCLWERRLTPAGRPLCISVRISIKIRQDSTLINIRRKLEGHCSTFNVQAELTPNIRLIYVKLTCKKLGLITYTRVSLR